ncbi:MAG: hypothetical protein M9947_09795 [Thermomicrobiales bacterium]|nr:hypothetical protein [Thermomicrobiales bacterium]
MSNPRASIDSAAAGIAESRLSDVLTLVHREGFGHNAQVIRPDRGRTADRLRRAGLGDASIERLIASAHPIVLIFAPARVDAAEIILRRGGAHAVETFAQSSGTQSALIGFDPAVLHNNRRARRRAVSPSDS